MPKPPRLVADEHDELIDATLCRMDDAGVFDGLKASGVAQELRICGADVEIERYRNNPLLTCRARVKRSPACEADSPGAVHTTPYESASFWGPPSDELDTHNRAMLWADRTAHAAAVSRLAAEALSREPDIVIEDSDVDGGEYWPKVCELADQGGKLREGVYIADITAVMDSPECSADRGGEHNINKHSHCETI